MTPLPPKKTNGYREPNINKARPLTIEFIRNKNFINKQKTITEFSAMFDCDLNHAADLFDHLVLCDYLRKDKKNKNQFIVNQRALKKQFRPNNQQHESPRAQLEHYLAVVKIPMLKSVRLQCIEYVKARRFISSRKLLAVFNDMFNDDHVAYGAIEFLKAVGFIELSTVRRGYFYVNHNAIHKSRYKEVRPMPNGALLSSAAKCVLALPEIVTPTCITLLLMHEFSLNRGFAKELAVTMHQLELIKRLTPSMSKINHAAIKKFIDAPTTLSKYQQADINNALESLAAKQQPPPPPGVRYVKDAATLPKSVMGDIIKYSVLKKEKHMWRLVLAAVVASFIAGGLVGVLVQ